MIPRRQAHRMPGDHRRLIRAWLGGRSDSSGSVARLERDIAVRTGVDQATAVSSGRRAMTLILKHLGVGPGDEVVIPALTLRDLVPLIQALGATVVPADVDPRAFNIDPDAVQGRLTERTRAVLVLHAFGTPCDAEAIVELTAARGIPVVEDCAHSLGATLHGRETGSMGHAGFFSFETTKPLNTLGGGMVVSGDPALHAAIRAVTRDHAVQHSPLLKKAAAVEVERTLMRTGLAWPLLMALAHPATARGIERLYRNVQHAPAGALAYTPQQAEMGLRRLPGLTSRVAARARAAERYRSLLPEEIGLQQAPRGARSTFYFLVARLPVDAGEVRRRMLRRGIDTAVHDEVVDDCAALLGYRDCPRAAQIARTAMALPLWDGIEDRTIRRVAAALTDAVQAIATG